MISQRAALVVALSLFPGTGALAQAIYPQNALCWTGENDLCPDLPANLNGLRIPQQGYTPSSNASDREMASQDNFDYFGWQMFIALNWPADQSGQPVNHIRDDLESPRAWMAWEGVDTLFPGNETVRIDKIPGCAPKGQLRLAAMSKFHTGSFLQSMTHSPLIDRNGNFVVYDLRANPVEAEYLRKEGLTTKAGQADFRDRLREVDQDEIYGWQLPMGKGANHGAIEIKTSWRILPENSVEQDYYTTPATLIIPPEATESGEGLCEEVTAALVGMHIMQKISDPPEFAKFWTWATFEHKRNAPYAKGAMISALNDESEAESDEPYRPVAQCHAPEGPSPVPADLGYAFYDPKCSLAGAGACPLNTGLELDAYKWKSDMPYAGNYLTLGKFGTQVALCWKQYESARDIDKAYHEALTGTVWENYRLMGVQWSKGAADRHDALQPFSAPIYMINSTMETFLQQEPVIDPETGEVSTKRPSSCTHCHMKGRDTAGTHSDFSFLGRYAQ